MNEYDTINMQNSKVMHRSELDVVRCLQQRSTGISHNRHSYDLKMQAEDIFVRKKFDELKCEVPGTPRSTFLMVFSPDGSKVASTHGNHNIYVTDVKSGKNIKILVGHPRTPWCIAFHPSSNQILASGCLGGQVRIWDLSGGSEVWTSEIPTVIASIAFHPDDRLLVIATYNELHFWDWSKREPFMHVATGNIKEKVRYVAFDKMGHKLITGISNSPQTRWERVRAPVPVPRQVDRSASPYRRRITPRLISNIPTISTAQAQQSPSSNDTREPLTTVPERERRITACYRNLVREYELLVHRYLQIYRPPTMIDQGTDPMEIELSSISGSNLSSSSNGSNSQPQNISGNESMLCEPHRDSFNSLRNNTEQSSSRSTEYSSRRTLHINPATSRSNNCDNVQSTDTTHIDEQVNPIDLSRYPEAQSSNNNKLRSQNSNVCVSGIQPTLQISNILPIDNSTLNSEDTVLMQHEISPRRSLTNINIAEEQENLHNSLNKELKLTPQSKNKRRNSAPTSSNSSIPFQESIKVNCDINLHSSSATRVEKSQADQLSIYSNSNVFEDGSVIQNEDVSNANGVLNKLPNSTHELSTQSNTTLNGQETEVTKNTSYEVNLENLEDSGKCTHGVLQETRNPSSSATDSASKVTNRETQPYTRHLLENRGIVATNTTPLKESNTNTNILMSEPMPSTSGISSRTSDYLGSSNTQSDALHVSKRENRKFFDHPRKRVYPSLLKKSRRPVIGSSSESSSSEEEGVATKRLCPTSPLTPRTQKPNNGTTNPILEQNTTSSNESPTSLNYNHELEALVTDLLLRNENGKSGTVSESVSRNSQNSQTAVKNSPQVCDTCGCNLPQAPTNIAQGSRTTLTKPHTCARATETPNTRTTSTTIYTSSGTSRISRSGRFFSHRVSAFYPTRIQNLRPYSRLRHNNSYLSPAMRNRLRILNTLQNTNRFSGVFALDEVINYSERTAADEISEPSVGFHPFDPPPEYATINPENIGIGNMYSNIVQELESSLNDVRNIRASNRIGETSDMLSSFSERLESIMNQSNAILRNLRTSIETLQPNEQGVPPFENNLEQQPSASSSRPHQPRVSFNDNNFYLRQQINQTSEESVNTSEGASILETNPQDDLFPGQNRSSATSDHTYPLNSRNSESASNNMSPLMASLHLTVSHIQRQARLLRQQVESIERIDRAMLEVAQLQMMRQMFIEMQCYFRAARYSDNISSMLRVRQMMAGTRISDSSPYDSPNESTTENVNNSNETGTHSNDTNANGHRQTAIRHQPRKTYPRCIFLAQRNPRRGSAGNILQRRCLSRERMMRRHSFRRSFTYRSLLSRTPIDLTNRSIENGGLLSADSLRSLTRRLESFLMEHGRHIGRVVEPTRTSASSTDKDEYIMMLRLNKCRARILGPDSLGNSIIRRQTSSVTTDGSSRYNARDILTMAIENLSELMNANITSSLRLMVWNVVDLSLLLSEILLLQIVDSIPPPSGMNLDPERESLSARIDQMCSRMLQNRLSGQSQQLTRCLRLTRLAVRHASRALNQTYTARRNSMLPTSHNRDQRRVLLEEINNCLRNIRRHGIATQMSNQRIGSNTENLSRTEWYRTIHSLITRYRCSTGSDGTQPDASRSHNNTDSVVQTEALQSSTQASSDDDNNETYWQNNNHNNNNNGDSTNESNDRTRPLYRTNNVNLFNLLNTEERNLPSSSRNRPWNIPTVQINDIPISQYQSPWLPRFLATHRQRLPERFSEIRTYPMGSVFRPRFLHPLHGSNPFETDFDESVREQIYDSDIMTPITPNHRIQLWEFSSGAIPNINNALKNVVVNECKIHNDASVDIASNGNILVTLLPSAGYLNGTNRLGVYSLKWESLGQCLYVTNFEQNAVSVSLSPLSRHLVVGLASRRVSVIPSEKWTMARIFVLNDQQHSPNQLLPVREVEQTRDPNFMSVNCIRWLPVSGQGLVYATNTGQLRILT